MAFINCHALVLVALVSAPLAAVAGGPDILTDFIVPTPMIGMPPMNITSEFFTYTGFRPSPILPIDILVVEIASMAHFPALNGQSVAYAKLSFPPGTVHPMHFHRRAAELLLVIEGALSVGFVDTTGKLYTKDLVAGDMFIFPKGLVHYQSNRGLIAAVALSAFGSASPGTVSVPSNAFGTGVDDEVLAKSFKTDVPTVQKLKAALTPPPKK